MFSLAFALVRGDRGGEGRGVRVQQVRLVRSQSQLDQRAGVRNDFRLPTVVALQLGQRSFGSGVHVAGGLSVQVVLADESFLNLTGALVVDRLLAFCLPALLR